MLTYEASKMLLQRTYSQIWLSCMHAKLQQLDSHLQIPPSPRQLL